MSVTNEMSISLMAKSENESFARTAAAAFVSIYDPLLSDVADIKTAVSEAVSNCVIHGYENENGTISLNAKVEDDLVTITVKDDGKGIDDVTKAREPLYTSKPELERSGMGFTVMETFMDGVSVNSTIGKGTEIIMTKRLRGGKASGADENGVNPKVYE